MLFRSDGGVRRNAVEPKNLVEAEAQKIPQRRAQFARGVGLAGDEGVEGFLPADDAADEFVAEAAVNGRKSGGGERGFEQMLGEFVAGLAL